MTGIASSLFHGQTNTVLPPKFYILKNVNNKKIIFLKFDILRMMSRDHVLTKEYAIYLGRDNTYDWV